jgi:hypothetical protein
MKRKFLVEFWYYTDLRCHEIVIAKNEISALAIALNHIGDEDWVTSKGFKIEISLSE